MGLCSQRVNGLIRVHSKHLIICKATAASQSLWIFFFQDITRLEKKSQGLQGHLALLLERDLVVVGVEKILLAFR